VKDTKRPPIRATKLLQAFLRHDLIEAVTGDLEEKFHVQAKRQSLARAAELLVPGPSLFAAVCSSKKQICIT